jgi:hypothetical protein
LDSWLRDPEAAEYAAERDAAVERRALRRAAPEQASAAPEDRVRDPEAQAVREAHAEDAAVERRHLRKS